MTDRPVVLLDIETRACPMLIEDQAYWAKRFEDIQAPANWKDPIKVEAYKTETIEKERRKMALDAKTGRVVVAGACLLDGDEPPVTLQATQVDEGGERTVLHHLGRQVLKLVGNEGGYIVAGWNIREFDLPFLAGRAVALGATLPWRLPKPRDYVRVLDGYEVLGGTLGDWMRVCGLPPKDVEGEAVLQLSLEDLQKHCAADLVATRVVMRRLVGAYPILAETYR